MKKVLIFGAVKHVIDKAKQMGYETIVIDQYPNIIWKKDADKFKCIPYEDFDACLQYAKEENVDGIVNATEFAVLVSSYVANEMKLPGLKFEVAKLAKSKYEIRKKMLEEGITNVPQFFEISNIEEVHKLESKIVFPVILKPCSGIGSLYVYTIKDFDTLVEKLPEVIQGSYNGKALIETFIVGQEYGIESFVYNGKVHVLAIMKKHMTEPPYCSELGHSVPSGLEPEIENKIKDVVSKLILALGIDAGPVNMDMILTKDNEVYIIDVGARMGGNAITSHIIPYSTGIDHVGNIVKLAMNEGNIELKPKFNQCIVTRILNLDEGIIKELPDFNKYLDDDVVEIFFEKSIGYQIKQYRTNGQRCGFVVVKGNSLEEAGQKALELRNKINNDIVRE